MFGALTSFIVQLSFTNSGFNFVASVGGISSSRIQKVETTCTLKGKG